MIRHALRTIPRRGVAFAAMLTVALAGVLPATVAAEDPPETWGTFGDVSFADVAIAPDGSFYLSDCGNARIYHVAAPGAPIRVFAGAGPGGFENGDAGDGGPALLAHFGCPYGLAFDSAGRLYVADHLNGKIRVIDHGIVATIAGQGSRTWGTDHVKVLGLAHAGDGGAAIDAVLYSPWRIAFDAAGNLYVGDRDHQAIRRIGTDGIITTVAGMGAAGYRGDGMAAVSSKLNGPLDMAFRADGRMVIADENNARIREVGLNGLISTIGGTGQLGCGGNGGPATAAPIQNPNSIDIARTSAVVPAGTIVFGESECHMVRMIRADGTIQRLVGTGIDACSGYDGPALSADLDSPEGAVFAPNGSLYVVDDGCGVLLRIDGQGISHLIADASTANN